MYWELIVNEKFWCFAQDLLVAVAILSFFCYLAIAVTDRYWYLMDYLINKYWKGGKVR